MYQQISDAAFWNTVRNDAAFHARFHGRVHPLQRANGGVDFHNPENLRAMLQQAQHDYETMPKVGMSAWARKNRIAALQSWLLQTRWVFEHGQFLQLVVANENAERDQR